MNRVVITGMGIRAPKITNTESFLHVLKEGTCTLSVIQMDNLVEQVVAGVVEDPFTASDMAAYKRYPRVSKLAIAAAKEAVEMANISHYPSHRVGVILGTAAGAMKEIAEHATYAHELKKMPIHGVALVDTHTLSNAVCEVIGATGTAFTLTTGCTASIDALLVGKQLVEAGVLDACVVGGADAPLNTWTKNAFQKVRSLTDEKKIENAGVPFSSNHKGFVMSEGAAVVVLEREQCANQRKQHIYGVVDQVVSRNEGMKMLQADSTGQQMLNVFKETIGRNIPTYINSQALGMETNDQIERQLVEQCFQNNVPITSIKGMIGHTFGAMGSMQLVASILSMKESFIPPTIKTDKKGFDTLPLIMKTTYQDVTSVAITTHSSSGNNACALVSAYEDASA